MAFDALRRDLGQIYRHRPIRVATMVYGAIALALGATAFATLPASTVLAVFAVLLLLNPPLEYLIHRYILHALVFLGTRLTARFWIRAHYAHHTDPAQEDIILANPFAVAALVATIVVAGSFAAAGTVVAWAFAAMVLFLFYEVVHFSNHLPIEYETAYLRNRRRTHALHHYHNETANYGICFTVIDRLVGTYADSPADVGRSATVRNLGYDDEMAAKKPLVRLEYEKRRAQP